MSQKGKSEFCWGGGGELIGWAAGQEGEWRVACVQGLIR